MLIYGTQGTTNGIARGALRIAAEKLESGPTGSRPLKPKERIEMDARQFNLKSDHGRGILIKVALDRG